MKSDPCWYEWSWWQRLFYPTRYWYVTVVVNTKEGVLSFMRVPITAREICIRAVEQRVQSLNPGFQFYCLIGALPLKKLEFDCLVAHMQDNEQKLKLAALKPAALGGLN